MLAFSMTAANFLLSDCDEGLELLRAHLARHDALGAQRFGDLRLGQPLDGDLVVAVHHRGRRAGGREQAEPVEQLVAFQPRRAVLQRLDIGQLRHAVERGDRDRADLAGLQQALRGGKAGEAHGHVAGRDAGHRRRRAPVRHVQHVECRPSCSSARPQAAADCRRRTTRTTACRHWPWHRRSAPAACAPAWPPPPPRRRARCRPARSARARASGRRSSSPCRDGG